MNCKTTQKFQWVLTLNQLQKQLNRISMEETLNPKLQTLKYVTTHTDGFDVTNDASSALKLDAVDVSLCDESDRVTDRVIDGGVGAERQVADQQRRPQRRDAAS